MVYNVVKLKFLTIDNKKQNFIIKNVHSYEVGVNTIELHAFKRLNIIKRNFSSYFYEEKEK